MEATNNEQETPSHPDDVKLFLELVSDVRANSDRLTQENELRHLRRQEEELRYQLRGKFAEYLKVSEPRASDFLSLTRLLLDHVELHDAMRELQQA